MPRPEIWKVKLDRKLTLSEALKQKFNELEGFKLVGIRYNNDLTVELAYEDSSGIRSIISCDLTGKVSQSADKEIKDDALYDCFIEKIKTIFGV